ncbi:hypothetical protein ACIBKX_23275 [Streptomyces sp. NPDC050658]|uniref:ABC transporter substrate-binding protein n=1 Tax=unclassified Streptomyces TaxID=2593676 RepID=UPI00342CA7E2
MPQPFARIAGAYARLAPGARRRIKRALAGTLAMALLAGLAVVLWPTVFPEDEEPPPAYRACGKGVREYRGDDECVGVTDGAYAFTGQLARVSQRIKKENDRITKGKKPYATIALMIPLTPDKQNQVERDQIVREVQGAYLAQYRANQIRQSEPPIRLVLANPGRDMDRWKEVSDQLGRMAHDGRDRLRAVFGFNLSVDRTERTIDYLTNSKGIAVVGGPITADDLSNSKEEPRKYPGLANIVPPNSDQARALSEHLKVEPEDTFLVEDTAGKDIYARSLRAAFEKETQGTPYEPERYDSAEVTANDFEDMVNNLCVSDATTVFFAGRPPELAQLITALGNRTCRKHYRLVTVSGASTLALDKTLDWGALTKGDKLTVEYATVTHESAWTSKDAPSRGGSKADFTALSELAEGKKEAEKVGDIGPTDLADGRTITTHDSAMVAIAGIRNRVVAKDRVPALKSVPAAWPRLHGNQTVRGASGWICLDSYGNPYDKAVSIVRLSPDKARHLKFQKLAWPTGRPPSPQCTAPPD